MELFSLRSTNCIIEIWQIRSSAQSLVQIKEERENWIKDEDLQLYPSEIPV